MNQEVLCRIGFIVLTGALALDLVPSSAQGQVAQGPEESETLLVIEHVDLNPEITPVYFTVCLQPDELPMPVTWQSGSSRELTVFDAALSVYISGAGTISVTTTECLQEFIDAYAQYDTNPHDKLRIYEFGNPENIVSLLPNSDDAELNSTVMNGTTIVPIVTGGIPIMAPEGADIVFSSLDVPALNHNGAVAFTGQSNVGTGVFVVDDQVVRAVAIEDDPAPGTGGGTFSRFFGAVALNDHNDTAFIATVAGGDGSQIGVFAEHQGQLRRVTGQGHVAPGTEGSVFRQFRAVLLNNDGNVAVEATIAAGSSGGYTGQAIFLYDGEELRLVARDDDVAASNGLSPFGRVFASALNDRNEIVFHATPSFAAAIFVSGPTGVRLVAHSGEMAATTNRPFSRFVDPTRAASFNDLGQVAFADWAVFAETNNGLRIVARTDDLAPGTEGATFYNFTVPSINNSGDTAFRAGLQGSDVDSSNHWGVFMENRGILSLVVRKGDLIDLGSETRLPINGATLDVYSLNDRAQLVLRAEFGGLDSILLVEPSMN